MLLSLFPNLLTIAGKLILCNHCIGILMSSIFGTVTTVAILLLMSRDNLQLHLQLHITNYELQITFTITFTISFTHLQLHL